jgi:hypothetical protein
VRTPDLRLDVIPRQARKSRLFAVHVFGAKLPRTAAALFGRLRASGAGVSVHDADRMAGPCH